MVVLPHSPTKVTHLAGSHPSSVAEGVAVKASVHFLKMTFVASALS